MPTLTDSLFPTALNPTAAGVSPVVEPPDGGGGAPGQTPGGFAAVLDRLQVSPGGADLHDGPLLPVRVEAGDEAGPVPGDPAGRQEVAAAFALQWAALSRGEAGPVPASAWAPATGSADTAPPGVKDPDGGALKSPGEWDAGSFEAHRRAAVALADHLLTGRDVAVVTPQPEAFPIVAMNLSPRLSVLTTAVESVSGADETLVAFARQQGFDDLALTLMFGTEGARIQSQAAGTEGWRPSVGEPMMAAAVMGAAGGAAKLGETPQTLTSLPEGAATGIAGRPAWDEHAGPTPGTGSAALARGLVPAGLAGDPGLGQVRTIEAGAASVQGAIQRTDREAAASLKMGAAAVAARLWSAEAGPRAGLGVADGLPMDNKPRVHSPAAESQWVRSIELPLQRSPDDMSATRGAVNTALWSAIKAMDSTLEDVAERSATTAAVMPMEEGITTLSPSSSAPSRLPELTPVNGMASASTPAEESTRLELGPLDLRAHLDDQQEALSRRLGEALANRVLDQIERGQWNLRLSVMPEHLGPIDIDLTVSGQTVEAQFQVSNAQTQALIQDSVPRLREAVGASGMDLASVWVSGGWAERHRGNPTPGQRDDTASVMASGGTDDEAAGSGSGSDGVERSRSTWTPGQGALDILI